MDKQKLTEARGKVIEAFINIEKLICFIISLHDPKKGILDDVIEILAGTFSFNSKIKRLEGIFELKPIMEELMQMNKIRNVFAHCDLTIFQKFGDDIREYVLDPQDKSQIDFQKLYDSFFYLNPKVLQTLEWIYLQKGGRIQSEI